MPNTTQSPKCATCVHRLSIPGDRHSRCNAGRTAHVTANPTGVRRGWFNWPLNFDPVWLVTCDSWTDEPQAQQPRVEYDPMLEILALLK